MIIPPREGPSKGTTSASAPATLKELDEILKELRKIDPNCALSGKGQYVSLIGSHEWNRSERRRMEAVFRHHNWKVTLG